MCLPVADVTNLVRNRDIAVEQRNTLVQRVNALQTDNVNLRTAIDNALGRINALQQIDTTNQRIIQSLKDDVTIYNLKILNNENLIKSLEKALKRERRKTTAVAVAGTAVSGVLIYLYITK